MTSRFDVRSRRLARALRQQTLLSFPFCKVHKKKKCIFQAVASLTAHGRFLLRNSCTCRQYAVIKKRVHYIPLYSWKASSHKTDKKILLVKTVRNRHYYFAYLLRLMD